MRSVARAKAAARGLELDIGNVRPGWFCVRLGDTLVQLRGAPAIRVKVERVQVRLTPWLSLRGVAVEGGEISIEGAPDTVMEQLKAWRAQRKSGDGEAGDAAGSAGLPIDVEDVSLVWNDVDPKALPQRVAGLYFERSAEVLRAGFASAELQSPWGSASANDVALELAATREGAVLRLAKVARVVGRLALSAPGEAAPSLQPVPAPGSAAEPTPPAASDPGGADDPTAAKTGRRGAERSRDLADWLAPFATQSWAKRSAELDALRRVARTFLADPAQIDVESVQLEIARGSSVLNVGPAPFQLRREGQVTSASFTPPAEKDGKRLTLNGRLPLDEGPIEISLEGGPISLQTLGIREGDFGLLGVSDTQLTLATRVELSPAGAIDIAASGHVSGLALAQAALAPEPLRDVDLTWGGQIQLDLGQRKFTIKNGELGLERVVVQLSGSVEAAGDDLQVGLRVDVPNTACQDLLLAAPPALLPQLQELKLGGTFALHSRVWLDSSDPKKTEVEWALENRCKVLETPEAVDPKRFRQPFQHFVTEADGRATELTTGPTTEHWVALSDITPNMETALIVCEDSRFFSHDGFDNKAIRDSILHNLRAGRFVRGASTLTMQLAKNLYLGREKTLSRKLQEAAFTLMLEERLSKEDILELYLNVVEFGPGIYGIRNAASHYFNSHPGELSLGQALYLGSVLPSPKANHFQEDGALRTRWAEHLQYLMRIARKINRISDDELEAGLGEHIVFGQAHPNSNSDFLFGTPLYELNDG